MAVIQKLRNSGLVVVVIVAALVLFVISDALSNKYGNSNSNEDASVIGVIGGKKYKEEDISKFAEKIYKRKTENDPSVLEKMQKDDEYRKQVVKEVYQEAWDELVRKNVIYAEIAKSNIDISEAELGELLWGNFPSATMGQIPDFQTNGKFDPSVVKKYFKQSKTNSMLRGFLVTLTESIKDQELMTRYADYIAKASVKSKLEKELEYITANQSVNGSIVAVSHMSIADKDIKVTDEDLEEYLEEHKEEYKNFQESRTIKYVVWDVIPTSQDTQTIFDQALRYSNGLRSQTNPDTTGAIGFVNLSEADEKAPAELGSMLWSAPKGTVLGPIYKKGKFYIYQKVAEQKDTNVIVRASHILIPNKGVLADGSTNITDSVMAMAKANELFAQVKGGASIAELASKYSTDQGSATNGGDLGWKNASQFVKPFAEFCKNAQKGEVGVVKTQYGFHVIKMMEAPSDIKIKYTEQILDITAGSETVKAVAKASREFKNAVENDAVKFDKVQEQKNMIPRLLRDVQTSTTQFASIDDPSDVKQILGWLFESKRNSGDVSDVFSFTSRHVVMKVEVAKHIGYSKVEDVKSQIEPLVRQELKGKKIAEKFESAIAKAKTPQDLMKMVNGMLIPADDLRMGQRMIPQLNAELRILGAAFGSELNKFSKPVIGKDYTAVVFMTKRTPIQVPKTVANSPDPYAFMNSGQYMMGVVERTLKNRAEIQDFRYKFEWF